MKKQARAGFGNRFRLVLLVLIFVCFRVIPPPSLNISRYLVTYSYTFWDIASQVLDENIICLPVTPFWSPARFFKDA
jgi:hypothetical protein